MYRPLKVYGIAIGLAAALASCSCSQHRKDAKTPADYTGPPARVYVGHLEPESDIPPLPNEPGFFGEPGEKGKKKPHIYFRFEGPDGKEFVPEGLPPGMEILPECLPPLPKKPGFYQEPDGTEPLPFNFFRKPEKPIPDLPDEPGFYQPPGGWRIDIYKLMIESAKKPKKT